VKNASPVVRISVFTLIRTDTTLDHSQLGREGMILSSSASLYSIIR